MKILSGIKSTAGCSALPDAATMIDIISNFGGACVLDPWFYHFFNNRWVHSLVCNFRACLDIWKSRSRICDHRVGRQSVPR